MQAGSIQGQKDDGPGGVAKPAEPSFRIPDGAWVRDALLQGLEAECSRGGTAERVEDSSYQEESIAGPAIQCEDGRAIPSSGLSARYPAVDIAKTSPPPPLLIEPDGPRTVLTKKDDPDSDSASTRCPIPPSPVPQIVGEYPGADPGDEKRESGAELGESHYGRYWKYTFTAILPVSMRGIRVRSTGLTIEDRPQ